MVRLLKQSTAYTVAFKMIDSADHFSKKTGLTCTVNVSKAGGSFAAAGGTVSEIANGWYKIILTTTDANTLGDLAFYITAAGADDTDFVCEVIAADVMDSVRLGLTALPNAAAGGASGLPLGDANGKVTLAPVTHTSAVIPTVTTLTDLTSTTYAESAGVPAATSTLKDALIWLRTLARNKITQTGTTQLVRNDGDSGTVATSTLSDDGTTFTRGKFA